MVDLPYPLYVLLKEAAKSSGIAEEIMIKSLTTYIKNICEVLVEEHADRYIHEESNHSGAVY
jgi:hypothetical protein